MPIHPFLVTTFAPMPLLRTGALALASPLAAPSSSGLPPGWMTTLTLLPVLYVAGATPFLVVFDVRQRRLPNIIVLPGLAVVAVSAAAAALWAHAEAGTTALVAGVTLLVFATFRAAGALASGDVKLAVLLAAALAPLAGASLALYALAGSTAALTAGLASLLMLVRLRFGRRRRRRLRRSAGAGAAGVGESRSAVVRVTEVPTAGQLEEGPRDIPLGPFLLLGFWVAVTAAILRPGM